MSDINEQISKWDKIIEDYEKQLNFPSYQPPGDDSELQYYLIMGREELAKLGKDNCGEIAYRLEQYAFHITRTINRNINRRNRLSQLLLQYSAGKLAQYDKFMPYEEKLACLINEDVYAYKINECKWQFQDRIERLHELDKSLSRLSNTIKSLSYNKVSNG